MPKPRLGIPNGWTYRKPNQITQYVSRGHVRIFLLASRTQRGSPLDEAGKLETHGSRRLKFWLSQLVRKRRMSLLRQHLQAVRAEGGIPTAVPSGGRLRNHFLFILSLVWYVKQSKG